MIKTDILIIGGGPAGILAGMVAKQINPKLKITLIKKEKGIDIRCSEPYVICGLVKLKNMIHSDEMISNAINLIIDEATKISPSEKIVYTKTKQIKYKKLIIATGALPFVPEIFKEVKNVFTLRTSQDVKKIQDKLNTSKNVVVIGGGAIGIELASFIKNKKITLIELSSHLVSGLYDKEFSKKVEDILKEQKIKLLLNTKIKKIDDKIILSKEKIKFDLILLCAGVRSDTKLAEQAGIKIGKFGIFTKKNQETNVKDIYACGDCAQAISFIDNKPTPSQIAPVAVIQGKVAGVNAAGGKAEYSGVTNSSVSHFFEQSIGRVGFTEKQAIEKKFKVIMGKSKSFTKYANQPNAKPVEIKLVFDKKTKRILGAQIFGGNEGLAQRINLLSLAIKHKMTFEDLAKLDYCAHPELTPFPFAEGIVMAAENLFPK
ncbi:FAD-dependent oxidoreductase [Candidatus Pacearchaeota archaeon]|nr:FAD-dependent oxidoreductase [Candidatus Pacearchaeota archaeon]